MSYPNSLVVRTIEDMEEMNVPLAAAAELAQLTLYLKIQLARHMEAAIEIARETGAEPDYIPPMPLELLPLIREIRMTAESAGKLMKDQPKTGEEAKVVFHIQNYNDFREKLSPAARAELARLEQLTGEAIEVEARE